MTLVLELLINLWGVDSSSTLSLGQMEVLSAAVVNLLHGILKLTLGSSNYIELLRARADGLCCP